MGLADRDYMKRQGPNDPYYNRLFGPPNFRPPEDPFGTATGSSGQPAHSGQPSFAKPRGSWWRLTPHRSDRYVYAISALIALNQFVLPHLTVDGRHWHFWIF
jgi:hypothetical protein